MHPGELFKYLCCYCCSVTNWCPALCDPVGCSTPGFPVLHYFQEFAQIHVYWVGDSKHLFLCHLLLFLPQPFQASGCFSVSQLFMSGGQSIGVSASASVLPISIQDWFPLALTGLISLLSKGLPRVFSTTVQKHQFFSSQPSLWSSSHIHAWLLEKP